MHVNVKVYPMAQQGQNTVLNKKAARTKGGEVGLNTHASMYGEGTHSVRMSIWIQSRGSIRTLIFRLVVVVHKRQSMPNIMGFFQS